MPLPSLMNSASASGRSTREDYGKDLWSAYQTIQENMLKGGLQGRSAKGKRIHTRAIHSIDTDIKLNRALWVMTETLLESLR
ncbi:hypothetical protein BZL69_05595 [Escherichia coli]|nr:hypothetical protein BZL69_05595 [Escherichia coli]